MTWRGPVDVRDALFGGRGTVRVWNVAEVPQGFEVALGCELSARGSVGPHAQEHCDELVIGVSGRGKARVDGVDHVLEAGAVVPVPQGSVLELQAGATKLRYLIVKARG
ncbi:MAG: cupin domain-containing protein [Myxococcaceae bacterium]|nr:cupin domain-containing protein [Myxococcaceae bacterium]